MEVYVASENYLYSVYICFHNTLEFYQLNVKKLIPNKLVNEKFTIFLAMFPWNLGCKTVEN